MNELAPAQPMDELATYTKLSTLALPSEILNVIRLINHGSFTPFEKEHPAVARAIAADVVGRRRAVEAFGTELVGKILRAWPERESGRRRLP